MKAISGVMYTPDGKPYQCVSFDDDELSSMARFDYRVVTDAPPSSEASSPVESLPERDSSK